MNFVGNFAKLKAFRSMGVATSLFASATPKKKPTPSVPTLKCVILGESGVGKTSLVTRTVSDDFCEERPPTVPAIRTQTMEVDEQPVELQMWDTSGEEQCRAVTAMDCCRANCAVVVYDISNRHSFDRVPVCSVLGRKITPCFDLLPLIRVFVASFGSN